MPGFIPEDKIAEIQRSIDIVELISGYIPLKRAGTRYKALCPFHHEKTPSFMVSPERQIFKCFGCNEGGDVFKFIMKKERVDFPEAVRLLAEKAGIKLEWSAGAERGREEKAPLYEANAWAAGFFRQNLKDSVEAAFARQYLAKRRISDKMIEKFQLGYAPARLKHFLDAAAQAKVSNESLERAGFIRRRTGGNEPMLQFRNRLMFPIRDGRKRFIAFGARALSDEDQPKYLNSPETPVFSKGRTLYGLGEAKEAILKERRVAIMEGYTDVMMAHQFGIEWTVAVLGTALGEDHVRELKRYADEVILVFDADSAGRKSSDRSLNFFIEEEVPVRIATLPEGEDPCDYLLNHGAEKFLEILNHSQDLVTYKMDLALGGLRDASAWQRARALDDVLETVAHSPNPVTRELLAKQVWQRSGVPQSEIAIRVAALRGAREGRRSEAPAPGDSRSCNTVEKAQLQAIESLLAANPLIQTLEPEDFLGHFADASFRAVAECVLKTYSELGHVKSQDVFERLPEMQTRNILARVMDFEDDRVEDTGLKKYEEQLAGALRFLKKARVEGEAAQARSRILASDSGQVSDAMLKEFQEKTKQTRAGAGAFYKGINRKRQSEARLHGQD